MILRIAGSPGRRRRTGSPPARPGARPARSRRISRPVSPRTRRVRRRPSRRSQRRRSGAGRPLPPCGLSRSRSSGRGAPDARCRVKGVSGLIRWINPALNGRSPGPDRGLREGGRDGFREAFRPVHDRDQDVLRDEPWRAIGPSGNGECSSARSSPRAGTWRRGRAKLSPGLSCDPSHSRQSTGPDLRAGRRG